MAMKRRLLVTEAELRRQNMVESQVRPSDVTDRRIIRAMSELPREAFVASNLASLAYMDRDLQVAPRRFLLAPRLQAKLVQLAQIGDGDSVLDVGAASGYSTALIARLAGQVTGSEVDQDLVARATANLQALKITNATVLVGGLAEGAPAAAPFDVIVINGCVPELPATLSSQLKVGGRLVAIVDQGAACGAMLYRKSAAGTTGRMAFDAVSARLPGFERAPQFAF